MDKPLAGLRVLIVEDEIMILMMIEGMLSDLGCTSLANAGTVAQAVDLVTNQNFDIAMLDMNLAGTDSAPVAAALTQRGVPFIYSTGNNTNLLDVAYREIPMLKKPFDTAQLTAALLRLSCFPAAA